MHFVELRSAKFHTVMAKSRDLEIVKTYSIFIHEIENERSLIYLPNEEQLLSENEA